jgi:hypothetical protein
MNQDPMITQKDKKRRERDETSSRKQKKQQIANYRSTQKNDEAISLGYSTSRTVCEHTLLPGHVGQLHTRTAPNKS